MEQFRQRIIASAHLKPLTTAELKDYINHRLSQANCNKETLFSDDGFQLIFEKTLGVPRKINIFVDRLLLFGFLEDLSHINCQAINEVANEMSVELTGSLTKKQINTQKESSIAKTMSNNSNMEKILHDVEEILESSIQQKVKMSRYLDKLIKQKSREFAELQTKDEDE
jgi:hypothetical protein